MTVQEENWELTNWVGVPWLECGNLTKTDRKFLLVKCAELKTQQEAYYAEQQRQGEEQQQKYEEQMKAYQEQVIAAAPQAATNVQSAQPVGPQSSDGTQLQSW